MLGLAVKALEEICLGLLSFPLRVQVPNIQILTQNLYYNYYDPKPKYLIIGYLDPLDPI